MSNTQKKQAKRKARKKAKRVGHPSEEDLAVAIAVYASLAGISREAAASIVTSAAQAQGEHAEM